MTASTRRTLSVVALAVVVVAAAWIVRASEGRRSLDASTAAFARGDRVEAIVLARAAAEARCPWCTAPELGYVRLEAIAREAEGRGDDHNAAAAWRAVRAATLASAVFDTSPARRERADAELARLEHRLDAAAAAAGGQLSPAASESRLRATLAVGSVPSGTVFVLLALGGALFLVGAARFVRLRTVRAGTVGTVELAMSIAGGAVAAAGALLF